MLFPTAAATTKPLAVTLAWDPSPDPAVAGYGIYLKTSPDQPFQLLDDVYLDELDDPDNPMVTLTGLEGEMTYYFAVTAFSQDGRESRLSEKVCVRPSNGLAENCNPQDPGDGDSSPNGSGCFFAASSG